MDDAGMVAVANGHSGVENSGVGPMVFVGGVLRDDVWVKSLAMEGVLDQRSATLGMRRLDSGLAASERFRGEQLRGATVVIAQPVGLSGGSNRVMGMLEGRLDRLNMRQDGRSDDFEFEVQDDWDLELESSLAASDLTTDDGLPWTVGGLLSRLNEKASLGLSISCLSAERLERRVESRAARVGKVGEALKRVCESEGLRVERAMTWDGGRIVERRWVRPTSHGRRIGLGLTAWASGANDVVALRGDDAARRPVKLVAVADGVEVESTFDLVGGWDPAGEGLGSSAYDRSTSGDFDSVSEVYRLWTLNEDGAYSGAPFERAAYDLAGLFDEGRSLSGQTTPFVGTLSQGDGGRSLGVVVEISVDSGSAWSHETGRVVVLRDRAGIYLDADSLPTGWAAAGQSGLACVRVTATLRNPLMMELVRWKGNPFAASFVTRRFELDDTFAYRRVDAGSKFYAEVQSGIRTVDEVDDQAAMRAWLVDQSRRITVEPGAARVTTRGVMADLRTGDRLTSLAGQRIGLGTAAVSSSDRVWFLDRVTHRWDEARSALDFISSD